VGREVGEEAEEEAVDATNNVAKPQRYLGSPKGSQAT